MSVSLNEIVEKQLNNFDAIVLQSIKQANISDARISKFLKWIENDIKPFLLSNDGRGVFALIDLFVEMYYGKEKEGKDDCGGSIALERSQENFSKEPYLEKVDIPEAINTFIKENLSLQREEGRVKVSNIKCVEQLQESLINIFLTFIKSFIQKILVQHHQVDKAKIQSNKAFNKRNPKRELCLKLCLVEYFLRHYQKEELSVMRDKTQKTKTDQPKDKATQQYHALSFILS